MRMRNGNCIYSGLRQNIIWLRIVRAFWISLLFLRVFLSVWRFIGGWFFPLAGIMLRTLQGFSLCLWLEFLRMLWRSRSGTTWLKLSWYVCCLPWLCLVLPSSISKLKIWIQSLLKAQQFSLSIYFSWKLHYQMMKVLMCTSSNIKNNAQTPHVSANNTTNSNSKYSPHKKNPNFNTRS